MIVEGVKQRVISVHDVTDGPIGLVLGDVKGVRVFLPVRIQRANELQTWHPAMVLLSCILSEKKDVSLLMGPR